MKEAAAYPAAPEEPSPSGGPAALQEAVSKKTAAAQPRARLCADFVSELFTFTKNRV